MITEGISKKYNSLIIDTLLLNGVKEVVCTNVNEKFFDRIVVIDGVINVYSNGLKKPFSSLLYSFPLDFSKVLFYIEEDLFLIDHGGKGKHFSYVFEKKLDLFHIISRILKDNNLSYDVSVISDKEFTIDIQYGDWKHDHGFCNYLMKENGYSLVSEIVTREDGSDCYDSVHKYRVK